MYEGTAKSMKGMLADECYEQAKNEGCKMEVVWQDGDSSAATSISQHHPTGNGSKCGGHVGRAHTNNLKEDANRKEFSEDVKTSQSTMYWEEDGLCNFLPEKTCSCKECDEEKTSCPGEPYQTKIR